MRFVVTLVCTTSILVGCTEVLRKPSLELQTVANPEAEVAYQVTGYDVTPAVIARANQSPFVRYVNVGGDRSGPVRRVPEKDLFNSAKPPVNQRPKYIIGIGDAVAVSRTGYIRTAQGVQSREASTNTYIVGENGSINLLEGRSVVISGLTTEEARTAVQSALKTALDGSDSPPPPMREFPTTRPSTYRLGVGDVIRVSRLIETSNEDGNIEQEVQTSTSTVGSNGVVSILQLGEIEAAGLTLPQVRDRVLQEAIRNAGGIDTVVEIERFASQTALVIGDLGTREFPISDQPLTFDRLIAQLGPNFSGDRDYLVTLERAGQTYRMSAKSILSELGANRFYVFDEDRISLTELLPDSDVQLRVTDFGARTLTYLRVGGEGNATSQRGQAIPFDSRGIDLRRLLIQQGIDVTQNQDLLVRVNRSNISYKLSAQSTVLNSPGRRYWLAPDDHVVVEDIAYVGDNALLVGEVGEPQQLPIDQHRRTTLSQALFDSEAFETAGADLKHIYVLRGEGLQYDAYHFDITKVLNLSLAEDFELRPGDIMFVRTRPLTRSTRALALVLLLVGTVDAGINEVKDFGN